MLLVVTQHSYIAMLCQLNDINWLAKTTYIKLMVKGFGEGNGKSACFASWPLVYFNNLPNN